MATVHHIYEDEEADIINLINSDPSYKIGDLIQVDFNNQMGERTYKIFQAMSGKKIPEVVETSDNKYSVYSANELSYLVKGGTLRLGDKIFVNDNYKDITYTVDLDETGEIMLLGDDGSILNDESFSGGRKRRKHKSRRQRSTGRKTRRGGRIARRGGKSRRHRATRHK